MVLKRKLPTHQGKVKEEKATQEPQTTDFDMELETETKKEVKAEKGLDLNDEFPQNVEDTPEDFIPEELRAMETSSEESFEPEKVEEEKPVEVAPALDDDPFEIKMDEDEFETPKTLDMDEPVKAQEPKAEVKEEPVEFASVDLPEEPSPEVQEEVMPEIKEEPVPEVQEEITQAKEEKPAEKTFEPVELPSMDFDTPDPVNWSDVVDNKDKTETTHDGFEQIGWEDNQATVTSKVDDTRFNETKEEPKAEEEEIFVPELPGMDAYDDTKPAEVMGSNSKDLALNGEAKRKLFTGLLVAAAAIGGIYVYSNQEETTVVANRLSSALTEATQDIAETETEQQELINQGIDITEPEDVVALGSLLDEEETDSETQVKEVSASDIEINLLEPEKVEVTASGKEIIKANGDEEIPSEIEEGASLISNISEELKRKKQAKQLLEQEEAAEEEIDPTQANPGDLNKQIEDELAEYRKLLAEEENPGKKVKPGEFFDGSYKEEGSQQALTQQRTVVSRVNLESGEYQDVVPEGYRATAKQVEGHQIVEYPTARAKKPEEGIRTLDHFRSLVVEKEDKRVRMPAHVTPSVRNQGFPKFQVFSIVPNYGLIGMYDGKKGILVIGDTFKGWELVAVYETYAEFRTGSRKHIITLK